MNKKLLKLSNHLEIIKENILNIKNYNHFKNTDFLMKRFGNKSLLHKKDLNIENILHI